MSKEILIVTTSLDCGGITSFLIPFVNELSRQNHNVTLAYTKDCGDFLSFVDERVAKLQFTQLDKKQMVISALNKFAVTDLFKVFFRKRSTSSSISSAQRLNYIFANNTFVTNKKFDIAISSAEFFCNALVANGINADKKIGWVHPDMSALSIDIKAAEKIVNKLDNIVTVSEVGLGSLQRLFPDASHKFSYIENMLDEGRVLMQAEENVKEFDGLENTKKIVTVCRIDNSSKRLDRVVKIAKLLNEQNVDFKWFIVGEGKDYKAVSDNIEKHDLQDRVIMLGKRLNPYPYIKNADCFVLTSQYEGKPVVIEEAKILHTPIISTEYTSAYEQIPKTLGAIVENTDEVLEAKITALIMDDKLLKSFKNKAEEYRYDVSDIKYKIENLISG